MRQQLDSSALTITIPYHCHHTSVHKLHILYKNHQYPKGKVLQIRNYFNFEVLSSLRHSDFLPFWPRSNKSVVRFWLVYPHPTIKYHCHHTSVEKLHILYKNHQYPKGKNLAKYPVILISKRFQYGGHSIILRNCPGKTSFSLRYGIRLQL